MFLCENIVHIYNCIPYSTYIYIYTEHITIYNKHASGFLSISVEYDYKGYDVQYGFFFAIELRLYCRVGVHSITLSKVDNKVWY